MLDRCGAVTEERRRHFWTTQPSACGEYVECGAACGLSGLLFSTPSTFATNDWVRSLLLNIFNTVARIDASECGNLPGRQGGHWSESYGDGTYIGTHIFESRPQASFREALALLNAKITKDAYKLVTYGVARTVNVATSYLGDNRVSVAITVVGQSVEDGLVNLSVKRDGNSWVWET